MKKISILFLLITLYPSALNASETTKLIKPRSFLQKKIDAAANWMHKQTLGNDAFSREFLSRFDDTSDQLSTTAPFLDRYTTTQLDNAVISPKDTSKTRLLLLHWVCVHGHTDDHLALVDYLVKTRGCTVNAIDTVSTSDPEERGNTALHFVCGVEASRGGRPIPDYRIQHTLLNTLLEGKAQVNARNGRGKTPLQCHLQQLPYSDTGIIQALIESGAILNVPHARPLLDDIFLHKSGNPTYYPGVVVLLHIAGVAPLSPQEARRANWHSYIRKNLNVRLSKRLQSLTEAQQQAYTAMLYNRAQALSIVPPWPNNRFPAQRATEWWDAVTRWQLFSKKPLQELPSGTALTTHVAACLTRDTTCPMPVVDVIIDYALPDVDYALAPQITDNRDSSIPLNLHQLHDRALSYLIVEE